MVLKSNVHDVARWRIFNMAEEVDITPRPVDTDDVPEVEAYAENKVNGAGASYASERIDSDNIDGESEWSFSAEDGNALLGPDGDDWDNYGKFHLGINESAEPKTKQYYSFPFGKDGKVYVSGMRAVRQRAAQFEHTAIFEEAGKLMDKLKAKGYQIEGELPEEELPDKEIPKEEDNKPFAQAEAIENNRLDTLASSDCDCEDKEVCDCDKTEKDYAVEQTFNLNGVEIFSTGVWNGDKYSEKDLNNMVENFDQVGFEPPIKIGHNEEQPELNDGQPALGYIDKIYLAGNKLLANFKELPKRVYEAIKRGNYKRVSSEIYWDYTNDGKSFDRVLKAVALLGADIPAVTNLEAITGLYKEVGEGTIKKHYDGKESEIMEEEKTIELQADTISVEEHEKTVDGLNKENEEIRKEFEAHKAEIKKQEIVSYMEDLTNEGKVTPAYSDEVKALLSTATDEKVYKFSQDNEDKELSQYELVKKIFNSMPKIIEFAELSENGESIFDVIPYDNASQEVDRRAKAYLKKNKADNYAEAYKLVLQDDSELKEKYERGE